MNDVPRIELSISPSPDGAIGAHMLAVWHEPSRDLVESYIAVVRDEREAHEFAARWTLCRGAQSYWV